MKLETGPNGVDGELDEDLHSRQIAVYGRESMHRMAAARTLVLGMNGLGVEVGAFWEVWPVHQSHDFYDV